MKTKPLPGRDSSEPLAGTSSSSTIESLAKQLSNPAEVLTVLLLIGGDVLQKAIAQVAGHWITPVSFSFRWVAYAFSGLMVMFGDGLLLPESDIVAKVLDVKSGNSQDNESWIIGRLVRDLELEVESHYPNELEKRRLDELGLKPDQIEQLRIQEQARYKALDGDGKLKADHKRLRETPLLITRWRAVDMRKQKRFRKASNGKYDQLPDLPHRDLVWWSYFAVLIFQFVIASIPMMKHGKSGAWRVLFITAAGNGLAIVTGSLGKWKEEKFACRMLEGPKTIILTRGNNHRHAFVIEVPAGVQSLRLEDLAIRQRKGGSMVYQAIFALLTIAWVMLLITIGGLEDHTWFLFGVGLLGMAHNVLVAGAQRKSNAHGIPLEHYKHPGNDSFFHKCPLVVEDDRTVRAGKNNVMRALMAAERNQPGIGFCLLPIFFPGELRPGEEEDDFWTKIKDSRTQKRSKKREAAKKRTERGLNQAMENEIKMRKTIERLGGRNERG